MSEGKAKYGLMPVMEDFLGCLFMLRFFAILEF